MPSNKDPNDIRIGTGLAGRGSISISGLTFSISTGGGASHAREIEVDTPLCWSADNVQEHVNEVSFLKPFCSNNLGESSEPYNASIVTETPSLVAGLYWDGGANQTAQLVNQATLAVEGILFPADQGVLIASLNGVAVAALNLEAIFVEGSLEATVAPARVVGQTDYVAGTLAAGDVGGVTQNIDLVDRLPALAIYGGSEYENYPQDFPAQQLAKATITVPFAVGNNGPLKIIHFRSLTDYNFWKDGQSYKTFAEVDIEGLDDIFYDDDTTTNPTISNFQYLPNDTTSASTRYLSGVKFYEPADDATLTWDGDGLYDKSFLEFGAALRWHPGSDTVADELSYTTYSGSGTAPGTASAFTDVALAFDSAQVSESLPELVLRDPFGREATLAYPGSAEVFPEVLSYSGDTDPAVGATYSALLPPTVNAGDLLLIFLGLDGGASPVPTTPGGWTDLGGVNGAEISHRVYGKLAVGTEDGTSVSISVANTDAATHTAYAIGPWFGDILTGVESDFSSLLTGSEPDPPSVTATWGSAKNLFFASMGTDEGGAGALPTDGPVGYTAPSGLGGTVDSGGFGNAADGITVGVSLRELEADTDDPGTFTVDPVAVGYTTSIIVRPGSSGGGPGGGGDILLIHTADYNVGVSGTRLTTETFNDEEPRYEIPVPFNHPPDGSGSNWQSATSLPADGLQVTGIRSGIDDPDIVQEGGVLIYPRSNYSSGYLPTGSPNYSAASGDRRYYRSFDVGGPSLRGRFRIVGNPVSASILEDFSYTEDADYFGHAQGLHIKIGEDGRDLGRTYEDGPGVQVSVEVESANSVIVTYDLKDYPRYISGYYTVGVDINVYDGSPAATDPNFAIYKIEWLPES